METWLGCIPILMVTTTLVILTASLLCRARLTTVKQQLRALEWQVALARIKERQEEEKMIEVIKEVASLHIHTGELLMSLDDKLNNILRRMQTGGGTR